jgi:putative peptidoglycan lipid II flippase
VGDYHHRARADTADKFALTTQLLRITFPYILLISLASLVGAILNTWNRFSVPALRRRSSTSA